MNRKILAFLATGALVAAATPAVAGEPAARVKDTPSWSTKAALQASAYAGLACDVADPRLKKISLPNGVGPEARVAAACLHLQYLDRAGAPTAPISIAASPTFPKNFAATASKSIAAGDRLTGQWGSPSRSYQLVLSNDAEWLCAKGKEIVGPGDVGKSSGAPSWSEIFQSGCPGAGYSMASWQGMNLGQEADTYFSWQLIEPADWAWIKDMPLDQSPAVNDESPLWYFPYWTHEFQHQMQSYVSNAVTLNYGSVDGRRNDGPLGWYSEGQAEYIGFTTSELTKERTNMRAYKIARARMGLAKNGWAAYDLRSEEQQRSSELHYGAGYLAYEYLLAHYGLEKTVRWWSDWNTEECGTGKTWPCWVSKAPELWGMTSEEMIDVLNAYVAQQLSGA